MGSNDESPRALLVTGTVGSGKTTVADAVGELLREAGVPHAVLDLDWLANAWPAPADDRFHFALTLRNLRALATNFLEAGAVRLVLAGVVETREQRRRLADALGLELTVVRLAVAPELVRERLSRRHEHDSALAWHLLRAPELDAILVAAGVDDVSVPASELAPREIAARVLAAAGWR